MQIAMVSCGITSLQLVLVTVSLLTGPACGNTAADPSSCSRFVCPAVAGESSGSGMHSEDYAINIAYTAAGSVTVLLHHTTCKHFGEPGPQWYLVEAVSGSTEGPAGIFYSPSASGDAFRCSENAAAVAFKSCQSTVLDLPARHTWTKFQDTQGPVCFRVKILPPNSTTCQTLTTCITNLGSSIATGTPQPSVVVSVATVPSTPSAQELARRDKCLQKWTCENARPRVLCATDGRTYPSRCHMRRQGCLDNIIIRSEHKGPCAATTMPPTTLPPPTTRPTVAPHCHNNRPFDVMYGWMSLCKCDGGYKRKQCQHIYGRLECWCSTSSGYEVSNTRRTVVCTDDFDTCT